MPARSPSVIPLNRIQRWRPCAEQYDIVVALYPDGVPWTVDAALRLHEAGVDVLWGALRFLDKRARTEFLLFTLRRRWPFLVRLLERGGFADQAAAAASLPFETVADARAAVPVLDAVWDALQDVPWSAAWGAAADAVVNAAQRAAQAVAGRATGDVVWEAAWAVIWAVALDGTGNGPRDFAWNRVWRAARDEVTREQLAWIDARLTARADRRWSMERG